VKSPVEFFEILDATRLRVTRPRKFILLCGGKLKSELPNPPSAREQFLRLLPDRRKFETHDILLAEDVDNVFDPESYYKNLIEFEVDIARISDAVVLFSEGFGSLAELGAFSQISSIAERMLVIVQLCHFNEKSFIRNGPIRYLQDRDSKSIAVFDWHVHSEKSPPQLVVESFDRHAIDIRGAIHDRLDGMPNTTTLTQDDFGHQIILVAFVADVFGAATFEEFCSALDALRITANSASVHRMLFCATTVKWLRCEQYGHRKFYLPQFGTQPCEIAFKDGTLPGLKDIARWKSAIRAYWWTNDHARARLLLDRPREGAPA